MSAALDWSPFCLREVTESDMAFLVSGWRQSFERESRLYRKGEPAYRAFMSSLVNDLLNEKDATSIVACDAKDSNSLLGFAVFTGKELHYVYVKREFRGQKLSRLLLDGREVESYAWKTALGDSRIKPKERGWKFLPRFVL